MVNFEILVRFTICLACPLITGRDTGVGLSIIDNSFVAWSEISSVRFRYPFKADLTPQIYRIIKSRALTQVRAGAILDIKRAHVSALMRYRSGNFSVERVIDLVTLGPRR